MNATAASLAEPGAPAELAHLVRENLRLLAEIGLRYEVGQVAVSSRDKTIDSPQAAVDYLAPEMAELEQEQLRVIMLDVRNRLLGINLVYQGGINQAVVSLGDVFREAVRVGASAVILAHNHPSGEATPSPDDVRLTQHAGEAGALLDIEVLDHIVIGRPDFFSLREHQLYRPPACPRSERRAAAGSAHSGADRSGETAAFTYIAR
jgi:DNA repair protein RadC